MTEENNTKIRVFGNDDESLKILGQLLSTETSRKIIQLLTQEEMYINQISKKLGIQMNITIFHLKKLEELGLLIVTHKQIVKKGVDHKYYKMVPNMFVTATQTKKEVHENEFLKKFFKEGVKFLTVTIAVITTWLSINQQIFDSKISLDRSVYIVNKTSEIPQPDITPSVHPFVVDPVISVSVIIICCSLFLIWFSRKYK